jgi:hypothetical protein
MSAEGRSEKQEGIGIDHCTETLDHGASKHYLNKNKEIAVA